jgi:hypothetical protein
MLSLLHSILPLLIAFQQSMTGVAVASASLSMFVCQGRIRPILLNRGVPDVLIFAPNRFDWPHEAFLKRQRRLLTAALFAMRRERPMGLLPDA